MVKRIDFETYLLMSPSKFIISVNDSKSKEKIFEKKKLLENITESIDFIQLEKFLEENIIIIEKFLNNFINTINLIIDYKNFFKVQLSVKKDNYGKKINFEDMTYLLNEAKTQCKKTFGERKVLHMCINKYIADQKIYHSFPENFECNDFCLEINFHCLSKDFIQNLEKIFSKYQISLDRLISAPYIKEFLQLENDNFSQIIKGINDGFNVNDVTIVKKTSKNRGFFEKFFHFFS